MRKILKTLLISAIVASLAVSSVFSAEWRLMQQPVEDEFGDKVSVNYYCLYGEDNNRFTDKFVWLYITEYMNGCSFANGFIHFGDKGYMSRSNGKPCIVKIKEDSGNVFSIDANCKVMTNGIYWECEVELDSSQTRAIADVLGRNESPKLAVAVRGEATYNFGLIDCVSFSSDANCMKYGHDMSDVGRCVRCGYSAPDFETYETDI